MTVTICIGSSCHIKGARFVVEKLQQLVKENNLGDLVELSGTFCMGHCQEGVCVMIGDTIHSVSPENTQAFFEKEIKSKVAE